MKYDHINKEMLPEYSRMLPIRSLDQYWPK